MKITIDASLEEIKEIRRALTLRASALREHATDQPLHTDARRGAHALANGVTRILNSIRGQST